MRTRWLTFLLLALILAAPSVYFLAKVPPLWRDLDGYHQVTLGPGRAAGNGHGLLYSLLARPPLWAGYTLERLRGITPAAKGNFYLEPQLTDSGVFALVLSQHLGLCAGALALVLSASRVPWVQGALAFFFASNPSFYALAHSVGSESLSLLGTLALVVAGVRLLRGPTRRRWIWFAGALFVCIATRHANLLLLLALPLTFALVALEGRTRRSLLHAGIALGLGLLALLAGRAATLALTRAEGVKFYSKAGFTFLWRLPFLQEVPEPRRSALLAEVKARARTPDARAIVDLLAQRLARGEPLGPDAVNPAIRQALPAKPGESIVRTRAAHAALNETVRAFLLPPVPEHWAAAHRDFIRSRDVTPASLVDALFLSTTYYFDHREIMPQAAGLTTFRQYTAPALMALPERNAYLHAWSRATVPRALLVWLALGLGSLLLGARLRGDFFPLWSYSAVLVGLGLLMMQLTAMIGALIPRYTFPLWELLWFGSILFAGAIGDTLSHGEKVRRAAEPG